MATLLAAIYLVVNPASADLAAQIYRSNLFAHHGFVLWDDGWYGGHHVFGYSVLFPPLGAVLGPRLAGALCAICSAVLFERLAREQWGARAWVGALWFAAATAMNLITGRLTFGLGVTFGLAALLALTHRRAALGALLAVATTLASPVAGLFLGIIALAWLLSTREAIAFWLGAAAIAPALALVVAFPEGGTEPFTPSSFWPAILSCAFVFVALPRTERPLRIGVVLYALACVLTFVIPSPIGGNVVRLGTLVAGPLAACLLWRRRTLLLLAMAVPLLWWQWSAPVRDAARAENDPSTHASYYQPLLGFLHAQGGGPFRIEIPFTASHWEAAEVAPRYPLARGWERQIDRGDNPLFYDGRLTAARYHAWLRDLGVRFVAVPSVTLDESAVAEARIVRSNPPWLQPVFTDRHWRVWRVRDAAPLATGAGTLTRLRTDSFELRARHAGTIAVRERFTPYWAVVRGRGCVRSGPDGFTQVVARGRGPLAIGVRFDPRRIIDHSPRCS